jgi:hypothetical protein
MISGVSNYVISLKFKLLAQVSDLKLQSEKKRTTGLVFGYFQI